MSVRLKFLSAYSEVYSMTTNVTDTTLDGQWLDFYALLDVQVSADEDTIRRRIGKVYADAAANTEHRDMTLRMYYQSLVERVLPQARRVLLDPQWRAKYDRQHILHSIGDPTAQNYVAFIAAMRGGEISNQPDSDLSQLPARVQDEIIAAREVVECARAGLELELLPSQAVKARAVPPHTLSKPESRSLSIPSKAEVARKAEAARKPESAKIEVPAPRKPLDPARSRSIVSQPHENPVIISAQETQHEQPIQATTSPVQKSSAKAPLVEVQEGEVVRAQTLTAQEARDIRRRRPSNVDEEPFVAPPSFHEKISGEAKLPPRKGTKKGVPSRVVVGDNMVGGRKRLLSPTSLNLMVAITGVLFTISIQKFASTPAVATSSERMPVLLAASPEITPALQRAEKAWEGTGDGQNFDIVVQESDESSGVRRALNGGETAPDVWIPASDSAVDSYNSLAPRFKRHSLSAGDSLGRTPVVLMARSDHAGELRRRFPNHQIDSWSALRDAVSAGAVNHFGMSDPQKTSVGALTRFSMAREWGESNGQAPGVAAKSNAFWKWMSGFEANSPSAYPSMGDLINDLSQDSASRVWWGLTYESDALNAMGKGEAVEVYYLPRTILADHPFCDVERVGAGVEVAAARQSFKRFLRSDDGQKALLLAGMRPSNLSLQTRVKGNPFANVNFQTRGIHQTLGRDERDSTSTMPTLLAAWANRFK
ncbi:hypothetical protein IAD21_05073 [Abditibacteriota bacterium]|nr:hypothetical protein IAD21_05073 [Abditibacteriota bacterium]